MLHYVHGNVCPSIELQYLLLAHWLVSSGGGGGGGKRKRKRGRRGRQGGREEDIDMFSCRSCNGGGTLDMFPCRNCRRHVVFHVFM